MFLLRTCKWELCFKSFFLLEDGEWEQNVPCYLELGYSLLDFPQSLLLVLLWERVINFSHYIYASKQHWGTESSDSKQLPILVTSALTRSAGQQQQISKIKELVLKTQWSHCVAVPCPLPSCLVSWGRFKFWFWFQEAINYFYEVDQFL